MATDLSNTAAPLTAGKVGTPSDAKRLPGEPTADSINSGMTCTDWQVRPIAVKQVDYRNLKTGEDFRAKGAQPAPLKGNDTPVRGATNDEPEGVGA